MRQNKSTALIILTALLLLLCFTSNLLAAPKYEKREDIPDKYKWDFSDIYPNWEAWEQGMADMQAKMDEFVALKEKITEGPEMLLKAFQLDDELNIISYKTYRYPSLMYATDTRDNEIAGKMQQVIIAFNKFGSATAWLNPAILEIGWETIDKWIKKEPGLEIYRHGLEDLFRQQKHILDEKGEKLLSYYSSFNGTPSDIYTKMSTTDMIFPTVTLSDGEEYHLTRPTYGNILTTNRNQADRKLAFEKHYEVWKDKVNSFASTYNSVCQRDWANAQARNYTSTLDAALEGDNVPREVYENLVNIVRGGTAPVKRYYQLRKDFMKMEDYHLYDGAIPIVDFDKTYEYDEIQDWIVESLEVFGKDYQDQVRYAFDNRWLDVYESDAKSSGAYSAGVYGVHPYMLLNYNETLNSVFTTAHELGHTMHSQLSTANQPFATSHYTIFVAEVASTLNEALFLDYMLEKTTDPLERVALLAHAIEQIDGTFYTQVMFSDFEMQAHELVEMGQPITADVLNKIMLDLMKEYYGDVMTLDDLYSVLWSRISHFFGTPFYVYKYATCFATSAQLHNEMTGDDKELAQDAVNRHLTLLKSGGNDYPMEQLIKAGIDLKQPEVIQAVVDQLDVLVTQLEAELKKLN